MATSTYKFYTLMATGSETDNWGNVQNAQQMEIIDRNLGGIVTKALTNVNVSLSATESQYAILSLTGTLTGNVQITTQARGFFFVRNATTGAFTVSVRNNAVATASFAPQGQTVQMISDATNGVSLAGTGDFPSGTRMGFQQTSVPTGWTKEAGAAYNDAAIQTVTGSVATGGTTAFSSVFSARTILQANLPSYTLPNTLAISGNQTGGLTRALTVLRLNAYGGGPNPATNNVTFADTTLSLTGSVTSGGSGTPMDFAVKYVRFIIGQKN